MTNEEKKEEKFFYVTTPIYYVNDEPHIGHAYTTLLADVLTRYHKLLGYGTRFLTGTDEHGLKVETSAKKRGIAPQAHVDEMSKRFKSLWKILQYEPDRFIRTTDSDHIAVVQAMLNELWKNGQIYAKEYEGLYYVSDEIFVTELQAEKIRAEKPDAEIIAIQEKNYFFKMSEHVDWLKKHIEDNPTFIQPDFRRNEVLGFLNQKGGVNDLCISRPKSRLTWGIELPFDPDYVCYVWVDALLNYVTGAKIGDKVGVEAWKEHPADLHLIGKDILTTHCVYWPTLLHGMGLPLPKQIFAHGWWLLGGEKMSKSLGNVIKPLDLVEKFGGVENGGVDRFRHLLTRGMVLGQDATLTEERIEAIVNGELANDLGNFVSRLYKLLPNHEVPYSKITNEPFARSPKERFYPDMHLPLVDEPLTIERCKTINEVSYNLNEYFPSLLLTLSENIQQLNELWDLVWKLQQELNRDFDTVKPWKLVKLESIEDKEIVNHHFSQYLNYLLYTTVFLFPVMPSKMSELRKVLSIDYEPEIIIYEFNIQMTPGTHMVLDRHLFSRLDFDKLFGSEKVEAPVQKKEIKKELTPATVAEPDGLITIDDVKKVELRIAKVLRAEKIEGATKLLLLQLDDGNGVEKPRQIVAGIAEHYSPDELIGELIVIVANLKPAKLKGNLSYGMLLAAKSEGKLTLVTVSSEIAPGASVG